MRRLHDKLGQLRRCERARSFMVGQRARLGRPGRRYLLARPRALFLLRRATAKSGATHGARAGMIGALRILLIEILDLYFYVIIAAVIASWLVGFGIINSYNPIARSILRALHA